MVLQQKINRISIFLPISQPLIYWYIFVILFMLVDLFLTIIVHCYHHEGSKFALFKFINSFLPIIIIIDILISFNTGFIKNGKLIYNKKQSNMNHKQLWTGVYFCIDVIALIFSILQIILQNTVLQQITLLNYVVFIKLVMAYQTDTLLKKYVIKSFRTLLIYEIVKNLLILALLSHIIGSFYFYLDIFLYQQKWYDKQHLWVYNSRAYKNIRQAEFWIQYSYSYYVACVTLSSVAYGDIVPLNPYQNLYIFFCFIFPMLIYSYVFSSIYIALMNRGNNRKEIRRNKLFIKDYLEELGVNSKLRNRILMFLEFIYIKNLAIDRQFINDLAPTIKSQYLKFIMKDKFDYSCFQSIKHIGNIQKNHIQDLFGDLIREQYFPQKTYLSKDQNIKIYYINSGTILEIVQLQQNKKYSKPHKSCTHLSKLSFLTNQFINPRVQYQSASFVLIHSIDYKEFKHKIKKNKFPINETFCYIQSKIVDQEEYQEFVKQNCFFCDSVKHDIKHCQYLSLYPQQQQQENFSGKDDDNRNRNRIVQNKTVISSNHLKRPYQRIYHNQQRRKYDRNRFSFFSKRNSSSTHKKQQQSKQSQQQSIHKDTLNNYNKIEISEQNQISYTSSNANSFLINHSFEQQLPNRQNDLHSAQNQLQNINFSSSTININKGKFDNSLSYGVEKSKQIQLVIQQEDDEKDIISKNQRQNQNAQDQNQRYKKIRLLLSGRAKNRNNNTTNNRKTYLPLPLLSYNNKNPLKKNTNKQNNSINQNKNHQNQDSHFGVNHENLFQDFEFVRYLCEYGMKYKCKEQQTEEWLEDLKRNSEEINVDYWDNGDISNERYLVGRKKFVSRNVEMDKVCSWDIYYPEYNIAK